MKRWSIIFVMFSGMILSAAEVTADTNFFKGDFWALLPPLLAILLALLTKEVYISLFAGVVLGGCFVAEFSPFKVVDEIIRNGLIKAVQETAGIFIFLVLLGIIVALINKSGAAAAFGSWAQKRMPGRRGAMISTFLLGVLIFVDDYFNCLTVGGVMRPVTDRKKISRAKLAYIIDATAAPVCMIAPISSWAAAVSQYASGTQYSGLEMFIMAMPYNFYSWLTLLFVLTISILDVDFGPMRKYEIQAMKSNSDNAPVPETSSDCRGRIADMLIPVILLIALCVYALVRVGGIADGKNFIDAFGDTDASVALPLGAIIVVLITMVYLLCRRVIKKQDIADSIVKGFISMVPAILILTLATALKNMTGMLEGREYIARLISGAAPQLAQFLPAVIFVTACALAFAIGTSWGTFGILIPIVLGIFPIDSELIFIGISACLAGAVCGDHCSPISDTTVMSSAGAECDHLVHVSTQLPYAIAVALLSLAGYLLAGIIQNWFVVFPLLAAILIISLVALKLWQVRHSRSY